MPNIGKTSNVDASSTAPITHCMRGIWFHSLRKFQLVRMIVPPRLAHDLRSRSLKDVARQMANTCLLDWETATLSIVAPISDAPPLENLSAVKTPTTPNPKLSLDTTKTTNGLSQCAEEPTAHNMVLFVSFRPSNPLGIGAIAYTCRCHTFIGQLVETV
jgi:hypothetical protein